MSDPVSQQVGYLAVMQETQDDDVAPIEVGLRLQLERGRIVEAEHLIARNLSEGSLRNLESPRLPLVSAVPEEWRDSRSRLLHIGASYYDALDQNNGALAPFADEVNGLAFGLSHFRHAFDKNEFQVFGIPGQQTRVMDFDPFDMPAIHIYKIWGGNIHEIEAIGIVIAYESPTGWE